MKSIISNILDSVVKIGLKVLDGYWFGIGFSAGVFWFLKTFTDLMR